MELIINGEAKNYEFNEILLSDLLKVESVKDPEMVSVQLNGEFVSRAEFPKTKIFSGSEIDFLYFMGGGK